MPLTTQRVSPKKITHTLFISFLMYAASWQAAYGQVKPATAADIYEPKPLSIGDTIPEKLWNTPLQVVNHPQGKKTITLADYKGRLIIFDFWATWCGACIEALPHMQDLQNKFGDDLQIIAVTDQNKKRISSFFGLKTHDNLKELSFPFVTTDSILHRILGVKGAYPFEIWVDQEGIIVGRTAANEVTEDNIRKLIKKQSPNFNNKPLASDPLFSIRDSSLIRTMQGGKILYSAFAGYFDRTIGPGLLKSIDNTNQTARYDIINSSLVLLASWALDFSHPLTAKECDLLVKDTAEYFYTKDLGDRKGWNRMNTFSYETVVPQDTKTDLVQKNLLNDLYNYMGVRAAVIKKTVDCLVIKDKSKHEPKPLSGSHYYESLFKKDDAGNFSYELKNRSLSALSRFINRTKLFSNWPLVVNESKGKRTLQLNIGKHPADLSRWRKELERNGLQLVAEQREFTMLQIKESNKTSFQLN